MPKKVIKIETNENQFENFDMPNYVIKCVALKYDEKTSMVFYFIYFWSTANELFKNNDVCINGAYYVRMSTRLFLKKLGVNWSNKTIHRCLEKLQKDGLIEILQIDSGRGPLYIEMYYRVTEKGKEFIAADRKKWLDKSISSYVAYKKDGKTALYKSDTQMFSIPTAFREL